MELCRKIYVYCYKKPAQIHYFTPVTKGTRFNGCEVLICVPSTCYLAPGTKIFYINKCEYRFVELENNIAIHEKCGDNEDVYVFPKELFRQITSEYVEPLLHNKPPKNIGCLLVGAPGTGKSTLIKMLARMYGLPLIEITPDKILSMWVGQSEKKVRQVFREIRWSEPCIVIIDECEWLLSTRPLANISYGHQVDVDIKSIVLDEIQQLFNEKRRVVIFAATNVKPSEIDEAFKRHGRFGKPIIFPLPDLEAVKYILRVKLGDRPDIDALARKMVNAGESMANILSHIEDIKKGKEPRIGHGTGRGYRRVYAEPVEGIEKLGIYIPREAFNTRSRFFVIAPFGIGVALIASYAAYCGKSLIVINDPRYVDEALHMANVYKASIVVPSYLPPEILLHIHLNADYAVFFIGKKIIPDIEAYQLPQQLDVLVRYLGSETVVRAITSFYNIKLSDEDIKKIAQSLGTKAEDVLTRIVAMPSSDKDVVSKWLSTVST